MYVYPALPKIKKKAIYDCKYKAYQEITFADDKHFVWDENSPGIWGR